VYPPDPHRPILPHLALILQQLSVVSPENVVRMVLEICATVVSGGPRGSASPPYVPVLLLVHIIVVMRNVVFWHNEADTTALRNYLILELQSASAADVAQFLNKAMGVAEEDNTKVGVKGRITVRCCSSPSGQHSAGRCVEAAVYV